jgi:hypothetical protein
MASKQKNRREIHLYKTINSSNNLFKKMNKLFSYIGLFFFSSTLLVFAQKEEDNIGTQVVNVIKPYEATISDAFKIKEAPSLNDQDNAKKENIKYDIFSFPVASTFVPNKGKVADLDKKEKEKLFSNYATFGGGNYLNLIGELYLNHRFDNNQNIGLMLRHHSTQGGINGVRLDDKYFNTKFNVFYGVNDQEKNWQINAGYQHILANWYGLVPQLVPFSDNYLNGFSAQQTYQNFNLGGFLEIKKSIFDQVQVQFNQFSDAYQAKETQFNVKPKINFNFKDWQVNLTVEANYLSTTFAERNRFNVGQPFASSSFIIGGMPSIDYKQDQWNFKLGAGVFYNSLNTTFQTVGNTTASGSAGKIYIFPRAYANFNIIDKLLVFHAQATGGLNQNSYRETAIENPFVAPNIWLLPTNNQLNIGAGLKGRFTQSITFNVEGKYSVENNKALFKSNDRLDQNYELSTDFKPFEIANSFGLVYDDIKTLEISGEIKGDINAKSALGLSASYFNYTSSLQAAAWNLPDFKIHAFADIKITDKWQSQFNLFYVGQRQDQLVVQNLTNPLLSTTTTYLLKGFFDANAQVTYLHNDRLSGFLKLNNLLGQSFERWLAYPVQGIQVLVGANYKFDF